MLEQVKAIPVPKAKIEELEVALTLEPVNVAFAQSERGEEGQAAVGEPGLG